MTDYRFKVSITKQHDPGLFRVTWLDMEKRTENFFEVSAAEMTESRLKSWKKPEYRLAAGRELFRYLDGSPRYFSHLLDEAAGENIYPLVYLTACRETEDWPFELVARGEQFLVPTAVHLVRCVSERGAKTKPEPQNRQLKMLFMACSAHGVNPELSFEKEEETIFKVTEDLAINMEVEDSGSLAGLKEKLALEQYDIVHLSGHAGIDKKGRAFFVMEDETGYRQDVYVSQLYHGALIDNMPRLVFLSGCHTGETGAGDETVSFCRELVEEYHVAAVLGWGRAVSDGEATQAATVIYRELSRGKSVLDAVRRARYDMATQSFRGLEGDWLLLRLFGDMTPLTALVLEGQKRKPKSRRLTHIYLKNSRVKVLEEGFVGRRRPLQQSKAALNNNRDKTGVLILGAGGLGKSCLAGKICERYPAHQLIIMHGLFNAITLEEALREGFESARDKEGLAVLEEKVELTRKLSELCVSSFRERNYLIVLDDFEQNLEGGTKEQLTKAFAGGPGGRLSRKEPPWPPEAEFDKSFRLIPEAAQLMMVLLQWLPKSGKMTQLIITGRYGFELEHRGLDLVAERLEKVYLASFLPAEQEKKVSELRFISGIPVEVVRRRLVAAGYGNPRLLEWLDRLVGEQRKEEVADLLEKVKGKKEEFIQEHVLRELLRKGGEEFGKLMGRLSIYRRPVLKEGVKAVAEKAGLKAWERLLAKGVELSVVEFYGQERSYGVTPLLREELEGENEECEMCHRAGMEYYRWLKAEKEREEEYDPVLVEELIFHALGCGEEEIAADEGGELAAYLIERLAFQESKRVGGWILQEKKAALSSGNDAILLNNLGCLYRTLGDQGKAIGYFEQALVIWKKVYGEEHTQVAIGLNNLGVAYKDLGELRKAIKYYEQALAINEKVCGKEHPSVTTYLNSLGVAYMDLGELRKAIKYYEQALAIDEKVSGKEHPNVAIRLSNLGLAYMDLGELRKATGYFEQALAIDEKVSGKEHPNVAIRLNNLGSAYDKLGEKEKAIGYHEQALAINEKVYGQEHPSVATDLNNLGEVFRKLGEARKAIGYYKQALLIVRKAYGEQHPRVAVSLNNLGAAYADLGKEEKAIGYYEQALAIDEKVYGQEHPNVAIRSQNLGAAYFQLGQKDRAHPYFEKALSIFTHFFGTEHPNTKGVKQWLDACG